MGKKSFTPEKKRSSHPKGQTILFLGTAIGALILIVASSVLTMIIPSYKEAAADINATKAEYLALGMLEQGLDEVYHNGPGYTGSGVYTNGQEGTTASYVIEGRSILQMKDYSFVIPEPGTGDAGMNCDKYVAKTALAIYPGWENELRDNPCNWGKIAFGETVTIPLYVDTGTDILNPGFDGLNLQELKLKLRTPCYRDEDPVYGGYCENSDRYDLDCGGEGSVGCRDRNYKKGDDTIVNWEIKGLCGAPGEEKSCAIIPEDIAPVGKRDALNSEIYESILNITKNTLLPPYYMEYFRVLYISESLGQKGKLSGNQVDLFTEVRNMQTPVLQFSLINRLKSQNPQGENVPYLEYQITYKTGSHETLPNNMRFVEATAESNGYSKTLRAGVSQEASVSGFVIHN